MESHNIKDAVETIRSFFKEESTGRCFLVNTEDYDVYHQLLLETRDDHSVWVVRQSEYCLPNGAPNVFAMLSSLTRHDKNLVVGLSQASAFSGTDSLTRIIGDLLDKTDFSSNTLILLEHCRSILKNFVDNDFRRERRVLFVEGTPSPLPSIKLANSLDFCDESACKDFPSLLRRLEDLTCKKRVKSSPITVLTSLGLESFKESLYPITKTASAYDTLCQKYVELSGVVKEEYGSNEQWRNLLSESNKHANFASLVRSYFESTENLSARFDEFVWESNDKRLFWLFWLALKVYGCNNPYLTRVLQNSHSAEDFKERLFLEIKEVDIDDPNFNTLFKNRKKLVKEASLDVGLSRKYCDVLGSFLRNEIFYLTDLSGDEKHEFLSCLYNYSYTDKEFARALKSMSENLSFYMKEFVFDVTNTKLSSQSESEASTFRRDLTTYFNDYKSQKLKNKIDPKFLERVEKYAITRPYNKLTPRSKVVMKTPKENVQAYFFDALGVEYLAFILEKSKKYKLRCEIAVTRCELPSITEFNREFCEHFKNNCPKVSDLDKVKHDSLQYDYTKCTLPVHIFEELEVIDDFLKKVRAKLSRNPKLKIVVFSDHGASRLAVISGQEASLELEEKGKHSGRCCPSKTNPNLDIAAYEQKYSCLANYQRYKGGRAADVEVHGGATLEETLVPALTFSLSPPELEIKFIESKIFLQHGITPELKLYASQPLENPKLSIKGEIYEGAPSPPKCYLFELTNLKRKGVYEATIFEGDVNLGKTLKFELTKKTSEKELF